MAWQYYMKWIPFLFSKTAFEKAGGRLGIWIQKLHVKSSILINQTSRRVAHHHQIRMQTNKLNIAPRWYCPQV